MSVDALVRVEGLRVELGDGTAIVEDASLSLERGQILGLVGESGSGKTTTALALLGYANRGARIARGSVKIGEEEILGRPDRQIRRLRGRTVSYVPQDPSSSLNPSLRVGTQVAETVRAHLARAEVKRRVAPAIAQVHLPVDEAFLRRFPHQLSGGQQQRVAIALALVCAPPFVVLDEPTTGLDVVTQAHILDEIRRLRAEIGLTMIYVSHDLAVVASIADRIAVMYAGRIVEEGPTERLLHRPRHPYTRGLMASVPDHTIPRRLAGIPGVAVGLDERPTGCAFAPRCPQRVEVCEAEMPILQVAEPGWRVRCHEWPRTPPLTEEPPLAATLLPSEGRPLLSVDELRAEHAGRDGVVVAAADVSFKVAAGECVALVGESGSGKTTIARCVAGLHPPAGGRVLLDGDALAARAKDRPREARRRIQIVFQNPNESLNPRHRVADAIARPARVLRNLSSREAQKEARELLERVRLPARLADGFPGELSGGERQRVAIARSLAANPDLVVCDEITSALDVSVQAAVLDLLNQLRAELGLALLFISHDLGVVAAVADRVLVLDRGNVCEQGSTAALLANPEHEYTQRLLAAAPSLPRASGSGSLAIVSERIYGP